MTIFKNYLLVLFCITILVACKTSQEKEPESLNKKQYLPDKNEVDIILLQSSFFKKELVSNGLLIAVEKSDLKFNVGEKISGIYVKNGDFVRKGKLLASLNSFTYQQKVNKAKIDLKERTLEFNDLKIRRGYDEENKIESNHEEYDKMSIKSGYKNALHQFKITQADLEFTKLLAPFSGKVANIKSKKHDFINSGDVFLTLINDSFFEVEFYVIESELKEIKKGQSVSIKPLALKKTYKGYITSINPQVENNGTILIKAKVKNDEQLIEGMNVKVHIEKNISDQFVVPKSAVVLRDNQEVLFLVKNGKAYWTYVLTTYENSDSYAVIPNPNKSSASLKIGDSVIVSNNLNLANDSQVKIKKDKTRLE
jgi:RND family efflux transporter MFP subunit